MIRVRVQVIDPSFLKLPRTYRTWLTCSFVGTRWWIRTRNWAWYVARWR